MMEVRWRPWRGNRDSEVKMGIMREMRGWWSEGLDYQRKVGMGEEGKDDGGKVEMVQGKVEIVRGK